DSFQFRMARCDPFQNVLASLLNCESAAFGRCFVIDEESPYIELHSFNLPLDAFGVLGIGRIVDAKLDQQWIFAGNKKSRAAWVALPPRPAARLIVDTFAFVTIGSNDVEATGRGYALANFNIGSTSGHVR